MTNIKESFLQALESDSYPSDIFIKLYNLINFKSWKSVHVRILNLDISIVYQVVKEYFSYLSKSENKSLLIQTIKMSIKNIPEIIPIISTNQDNSFYTEFVIFGCEYSTDIDVACIVRDLDHSNGEAKPIAKSELERLYCELGDLGYDISRGVDISEIAIGPGGNVIAISKGSKEIQNMIYKTYHLHKQKYSCPVNTLIDVEQFDKIRGLSKFILDNLYDLVDNSIYSKKEISSIRKQVYMGGADKIIEFGKEITKYVQLSNLGSDLSKENVLSVLKSLVMKYIQLILLEDGVYAYSKIELAIKIAAYIPDSTESAKYFLFRGRKGIYDYRFLSQLHQYFVRIVLESCFIPIVSNIDIGVIENITNLDDRIFNQFLKSPISPTTDFEELWVELYNNSGINSLFVTPGSNPDELFNIKNVDSESIIKVEDRERFLFVEPRSSQWLDLLTIYRCGSNTKIISDSMESKYNLIRGSIGELIVSEYLDFKLLGLQPMIKLTIGLIVENIKPGSKACCPDLILVSDSGDEIIPVEIKCLKTLTKNKDYYRGINLAKKQCIGTIELFGRKYSHLINRYLIIIVGWSEYKIEHIFFNK